MPRTHKKTTGWSAVLKFLFITAGAIMAAVALELFIVPNAMIDGGITGISIILSHLTGWPLGLFLFVINLPFLWLGFRQVGRTFAVSSLYGIGLMSAATALLHPVPAFTSEKLLALAFGGLILGTGIGLVLRFGGSLDGTEIVAIIISAKIRMSVGQIIMILNLFIFIAAGFLFGWDSAMYSIFTYYIAFKMIDVVVEGLNESKSVTIISTEFEEISDAIIQRLGRTTTFIYAKGGYLKEDLLMIYCVVTRLELAKLRAVVHDIDVRAFIAIESVSEVQGGDFRKKDIH
ncbi:YitT family protein [Cohnella nanjingensis]|uniref:YitT family protein n=1 Tax=Cohnella nanjingensis TaxID=1387779 RepID=A0A7X0RTS9_9BACL|nr:YitT family protein [Cohnella nanjingensis]MBB6673408.1 YitT family protein [Cohnella nanjingensis]